MFKSRLLDNTLQSQKYQLSPAVKESSSSSSTGRPSQAQSAFAVEVNQHKQSSDNAARFPRGEPVETSAAPVAGDTGEVPHSEEYLRKLQEQMGRIMEMVESVNMAESVNWLHDIPDTPANKEAPGRHELLPLIYGWSIVAVENQRLAAESVRAFGGNGLDIESHVSEGLVAILVAAAA